MMVGVGGLYAAKPAPGIDVVPGVDMLPDKEMAGLLDLGGLRATRRRAGADPFPIGS